jgi:hypothetical protein
MEIKIETENFGIGFWKGLAEVKQKDRNKIISDIYKILDIHNRTTYYDYVNGKIICKSDKAIKLMELFNSYDITNIWGGENK